MHCFVNNLIVLLTVRILICSWLDHCITTASSQSIISNMYVNNDIVCSDHFPLCIDIDCDIPPIYNETVVNCQRNVYK